MVSDTTIWNEKSITIFVLILVLMEYGLWPHRFRDFIHYGLS